MTSIPDIITPKEAPTLSELFSLRARRTPENIAYRYCNKENGQWIDISWQEMQSHVDLWRTAMMREKLEPGDRVALMLANSPEWVSFDLAAHAMGLIVVPLYMNDRPENIAYILEDTGSKLFVCPGMTCWKHLSPVFEQLDRLQRIVTMDYCQTARDDRRVQCLDEWLPEKAEIAEETSFAAKANDTATIVYTSGTTGPPKGVMLSHSNMISNAYAGLQCMSIYHEDIFLSFLPLSHMLERTAGYYLPLMAGATVVFARSIPELAEDLVTIKPTVLVAVPRIFERIYSGMLEKIEKKPQIVQKLFRTAVAVGWQKFEHEQKRADWSPAMLINPLLDKIVAKNVREKLGGRLRIIISGGAPLSPDIAKVFIGLGLPIYQGYGLTETSPVVSVNTTEKNDPKTVGILLPEVEVQLGNREEILIRGPGVMQGYWNKPEATAEAIDDEGWFHSGDRGALENGRLRITGRIKEVIVLSNGEKVSPSDVEQAISLDPLFEQSMVIGEGKPYLVLLAVLSKERWSVLAEDLGVPEGEGSLALETVQQAILQRIEKLMHNFPGYAFVKKAVLTLEPWTVEGGMLTPTMKIRRKIIENRLQMEIDKLYL
jgi:long-chain acyl-CoA synthetase